MCVCVCVCVCYQHSCQSNSFYIRSQNKSFCMKNKVLFCRLICKYVCRPSWPNVSCKFSVDQVSKTKHLCMKWAKCIPHICAIHTLNWPKNLSLCCSVSCCTTSNMNLETLLQIWHISYSYTQQIQRLCHFSMGPSQHS